MAQHKTLAERARRQFAALRGAAPGPAAAGARAFPDDWFDLPAEAMADLGAMFYLASLIGHHRARPLAAAAAGFEPALRLGQYHIFRSNGFARAFVTWAGLDAARERAFALDHRPLSPEDWNSGPSVWLVDFVAPFGHFDEIVPRLTENPTLTRLRTLWHDPSGEGYRIIEWTRPDPQAEVRQKSWTPAAFARRLAEA